MSSQGLGSGVIREAVARRDRLGTSRSPARDSLPIAGFESLVQTRAERHEIRAR